MANGFNAIKGDAQDLFAHPDGGRKIYSPEKLLAAMLNAPLSGREMIDEPLFWHYSKAGIRDRLHWLRTSGEVTWEVPDDVSRDYLNHMDAEELIERKDRLGAIVKEWVQRKARNDLFVCECYIAMMADIGGFFAAR
jgi:hypothetical protein